MPGKIYLVGIGPGNREHTTPRACRAIKEADAVVGYKKYVAMVRDLVDGRKVVESGMGQEVERAKLAVEMAISGKSVALISGGDPGIYGMASAVFEHIREKKLEVEVEVVPGITAANASSALLGSPLGHDFAVISLSDLMTPWKVIEKRLEAAATADFCIVLYNPKSSCRRWQIEKAVDILMKHRGNETPVGVVRNAMRKDEKVHVTTLGKLANHKIDMLTTLIVGNSESFIYENKIVTPRGYASKYDLG